MTGPALLPDWAQLAEVIPGITVPMRRYLEQVACVLRPGSVSGADLALRSFAAFLAESAPEVTCPSVITRRHVEAFKPWLAARPGQNKPRLTTATIAHRLGTLRMFFVRITEWGWDEAPPRVPMFPGDLPRQDHPLPKALDDAAAAGLLRAAQNDRRMLVGVTVEMLLRTGLRVSEFTGLRADAVVLIGAGPWLHVPVGKLREDRYLPLHPQLVTLTDGYRTAHVPPGHSLLLPRENGRPLDRHTVTRMINRAGAAAGLPHIHPHQLRHTLATQAINRGMSLEAIAALLGHYAGDLVKLIMLRDCLVEAGQQSVEDFLAPSLALGGGVVALLFEGGTELDGGLEERARFADGLEVAVQADGAGAVAVAEHPLVHFGAELAHLGRPRRRRAGSSGRRRGPRPSPTPRSIPRPRCGWRCGHTPWSSASIDGREGRLSPRGSCPG